MGSIQAFLELVGREDVDYDSALDMGGVVVSESENFQESVSRLTAEIQNLKGVGQAIAFLTTGALLENGAKLLHLEPFVDAYAKAISPALKYMEAVRTRGIEASPDCECAHDELEYLTAEMELEVAEANPEGFHAWQLLDLLTRGFLSTLLAYGVRGPLTAQLLENIDFLAKYEVSVHFVRAYLRLLDEEIIVIDPVMLKGARVRVSGCADVFQFHTLLASELDFLPADAEAPSAQAVSVVAGDGPTESGHVVVGPWQFSSWRALAGEFDPEDTTHWIWNEALPFDIPKLRSERVVVLLAPRYPRTWSASRLFEGVEASVEIVGTLDEEQVKAYIDTASHELERDMDVAL